MSPITPLGSPSVSAFTTTVPGLRSSAPSATRKPTVAAAKPQPSLFARFAYTKFDTETSSMIKSPVSHSAVDNNSTVDAKPAQPAKVKRAHIIMYGSHRMGSPM